MRCPQVRQFFGASSGFFYGEKKVCYLVNARKQLCSHAKLEACMYVLIVIEVDIHGQKYSPDSI